MPEYLPTNDGRPLKTQDAMLDRMSDLYAQLAVKDLEIEGLKADLMVAVDAALVKR